MTPPPIFPNPQEATMAQVLAKLEAIEAAVKVAAPIVVDTPEALRIMGGMSRESLSRLTRKHGLRPVGGRWDVEALRTISRKESGIK